MASDKELLLHRLEFQRKIQTSQESTEKFASELETLIQRCQFTKNERKFLLRDRFLAGLQSKSMVDEIIMNCQKPLDLTFETCLELVKNFKNFDGIKEEEFNEVFNDVEACLRVDLKFDYEIMSSIPYGCKAAILVELLNNKEIVRNQHHQNFNLIWEQVYNMALKNGGLFESIDHFKAIFERWKMDALEAKRLGLNRPQSGDILIWELYNLQGKNLKILKSFQFNECIFLNSMKFINFRG